MFSGHPLQADIQSALLYPIAAANEWLGGRGFDFLRLEWEAIVHFGLAATFTFLLVRLLTGSLWAGLLGAVTFTFGGFLTSYPSQQLPVLESTVWLPLELYCIERAARALSGRHVEAGLVASRQPRVASASGLPVDGGTALTGPAGSDLRNASPSAAAEFRPADSHSSLWLAGTRPPGEPSAAGLPADGRTAPTGPVGKDLGNASPSAAGKFRPAGSHSSLWLAGAGVCLGLAVLAGHPQTVLYLAYLGAAYFLFRLPWRSWWRGVWAALPAIGLAAVQLLPTLQLFAINRRGGLDFSFAAGGLQLGDLAGLVLDRPSGGRILYLGMVPLALALLAVVLVRSRQVLFWGVVAVIGLLLSMGTYGPLFRLFFQWLPGWDLFRDQERAVVWLAMAGAILAGYGLAALPRWPAVVPALLVLAAFGNLWWANGGNNLSATPPGEEAIAGLLKPVLADSDIFRVRISEESLGHDTGNLFGLQFVTGDSPFELAPFQEWTQDGPSGNRVTEWQLLRLTNSHYVVSSRELCTAPCGETDGLQLLDSTAVPAGARLLESQRGATAPATRLYLYQVLFPLPRAFFLTQAEAVGSERQAIDRLNQPDFDGGTMLLLQGASVAHSSPRDPSARLQTDVVGYAPGFMEVRTSSDRPAYLYMSEVAYPDWQATIDGQPAPLLTADGIFQALDVPPGDHRVVLQYVPKPFFAGAAISALTLLCLAVACARAWLPARAPVPSPAPVPAPGSMVVGSKT